MRARLMPAFVLVVLLAGSFSLAAADAAHGHDGVAGKVCQFCHAVHIPGLQAASGGNLPPPVRLAFPAPDAPALLHADPARSGGVSRAPPLAL